MFGMEVQIEDRFDRVLAAEETARYRNFGHAAASIRKSAQASIVDAPGPSAPGTPPHTRRRGKRPSQIRRAIVYSADKFGAIVGPRASVLGTAGGAHEFGGSFRGSKYPQRPFMFPALFRNQRRFGQSWAGSIHN